MKRPKHGLFAFPPKKTLIWRRHCSIGQSCCSMTSKRSIDWFLESSLAWSFFNRAFALKQTKSYARLYPFDKPIKSLYFRSFVVSVLFARFHFKVIRKSLYFSASHSVKQTNCFSRCCGRVQSQNDVIQKIEMTLNNIHTTTQSQTNNGFRNIKKPPTNLSEKIQTWKPPPSDV